MAISWAELSQNQDQNSAFQQICAFFRAVDRNDFTNAEISQVLLAGAFTVIDYDDPEDALNDFNHRDERARQIRLSNFMDYALEYTKRRLGQRLEIDRYLDGKLRIVDAMKESPQRDLPEIFGPEFEDLINASDELCTDMIGNGLSRLSVAKAYLDMAFIAALLDSDSYYKDFADQVMRSLDPNAEALRGQFSKEQARVEKQMLMAGHGGGSTTVH